MKSLLLSMACALAIVSCTQSPEKTKEENSTQASSVETKETKSEEARYELHKTKNMWNYIKLDTQTGLMWLVQYSMQEENRGTTLINDYRLSTDNRNGRFTMYQTDNIYTFMLLDKIDGRTWQVQWSFDEDKRLVIPIN